MSEIGSYESAAREMTALEHWKSRARRWLWRLRRKLPFLVWYGDELDVLVQWREDRLPETGNQAEALQALFSGALRELEVAMRDVGVSFDTGMGCGGRDWEWDYSLQGPISVTFKGRAAKPERRRARPRPQLVVNNPPAA